MRLKGLFLIFGFFGLILSNRAQIPASNLKLWLRADSGIVLNNGAVESWLDVSGNNNNVHQTNPSFRPVLFSDYLGGMPVVAFDGVNDFLNGGNILNPGTNSHTVFILASRKNGNSAFFTKTNIALPSGAWGFTLYGNNFWYLYVDNSNKTISTTPFPNNSFALISATNDRNNSLNKLYFNSAFIAQQSINGSFDLTTNFPFYVGAYNFGSYNDLFLSGEIAEIIIYDVLLSESNRIQVEEYLKDKYAPPVNLGPDIYVNYGFCPVQVQVPSGYKSVLWSTGSTNNTISISQTGNYFVQATDIFNRISYDTVYVEFLQFNFPDTTICLNDTAIFVFPFQGTYSFEWSDLSSNSFLIVNQEGEYWLRATDSLGCYMIDSFYVSVDSFANNISLGNDTSLCSGNTIELTSGQNQAVSYLWTPGNETTSSIQIDTSGWYSVNVFNSNGCFATDSIHITIIGTAPAPYFQYYNLCFGDSTIFTDFSTPQADIAQVTWIINNNDTLFGLSVKYQFPDTGIHQIKHIVQDFGGCSSVTSFNINILAVPEVHIVHNPVCAGTTVQFYGMSNVPPGSSISVQQWHIDGIHAGNTDLLEWSFQSAGVYEVIFTVLTDDGCESSDIISVQVNDSFPVPGNFQIFNPLNNSQISDTTLHIGWNFSSGALYYKILISTDSVFSNIIYENDSIFSTTKQVNLPGNGVYFLKILACNPCNSCIESTIIKFTVFSPSVFSNLKLWLRADNGIVSNNSIVESWFDNSGNGNHVHQTNPVSRPALQNNQLGGKPVVAFDGINDFLTGGNMLNLRTNSHTVFILGKRNNANSSFFTKTNIALPSGAWGFTHFNNNFWYLYVDNSNKTISTASFPMNKFTLISATNDRAGNLNKLYFNSAFIAQQNINGSYDMNSSFPFYVGAYNFGSYIDNYLLGSIAEILIYDTLLIDTDRIQIEEYLKNKYAPPVNLGPDIYVDYGFCPLKLEVLPGYVSIFWSTGSIDDSITVDQTGNYWVQVTDVFGRISSDTVYVQFPHFSFSDTLICFGDSVQYTSLLQGEYGFLWSDASTDPDIFISQQQTYWLKLTDSLGCSFTDTFFVAVDSFAVIASLGPDLTLCSGESIGLISGNQPVYYLWSTAETNSDIIVQNEGEYSLTVTNVNGCIAKDTINILLQGYKPVPGFLADSVCFGFPTGFTDTSASVAPEVIINWEWTIDGNQFQQQHIQYQFTSPGNHAVQLYVETDSGCAASIIKDVYVRPNPQAAFMPLNGCSEKPVQFTNLTTLPTGTIQGWEWQATDTAQTLIAFSTDTHPVFTFSTEGVYTVRLIAFTLDGCRDTSSAQVEIRKTPPVDFSWQNSCLGQTTSFTETTQVPSYETIIQRLWNFGDNQTSSLPNPTHIYSNPGIYQVSLFNRSLNGCENSITQSVEIHHLPVAGFSYSLPCLNTPVLFSDTSTVEGGTIESVMWTFPTGITSNLSQSLCLFPDTGSFHVSLIVTSNHGCENSIEQTITVYPFPAAAFTFSPEYGVPPLTVAFSNQSIGAETFLWSFGDFNTSAFLNPSNTYLQENVYTVSLIATNSYLCSDTAYGTVYVIPSTYDVAVTQAVQTEEGQYVRSEIFVKNLGTRNIRNLLMKLQADEGTPVFEQWEGFLLPGEGTWYTFYSLFENEILLKRKMVCFSALPDEDVEDVNPQNNTLCRIINPGFYIMSVSPNPAATEILVHIILREDGPYHLELISSEGKRIIEHSGLEGIQGINTSRIDVSALNQGIYLLRVSNVNESDVERVLILR